MANNKEDNARMLDPQRFQVAKNMAVMPGGPMNNNPMNVGSVDVSAGSLDGVNRFPYGDSGMERAPQMGTQSLFPADPSGFAQNAVFGVGKNAGQAYGQQNQPPSDSQDMFESGRLGNDAQVRGLYASPMGALGQEAQPAPGGSIPSIQQTGGTIGLQGTPNAEVPSKGGMNMRTGKRSK